MALNADTGALRRAAATLRLHSVAAGQAASTMPGSIDPSVWEGPAAQAVSQVFPRYRSELSHASRVFDAAAAVLDSLASRLDQKLAEIAVARRKEAEANHRAATASLTPGIVVDTVAVFTAGQHRRDLEREAQRLIALAGDEIKRLASEAPRSKAEHFRVGGIPWYKEIAQGWHDSGGLWAAPGRIIAGVAKWGWKLGSSVVDLALHENTIYFLINPKGYLEYNQRLFTGLWNLGNAAWHDPGHTAYVFFEIDTLKSNPAEWIGEVGPDVVLTVIAGAGLVSKGGKILSGLRAGSEGVDLAATVKTTDALGGTVRVEGTWTWSPGPLMVYPSYGPEETQSRFLNAIRHYEDHVLKNGEFSYSTAGEYYTAAKSFVTDPPADVLLRYRPNGERVFYSPSNNLFAVVTKDNELKTFMRPNQADNMAYFLAQGSATPFPLSPGPFSP